VIVKLKVPSVVGVPDMSAVASPLALSVRPGGKAPLDTVNVYGGLPPVARTVWLYGIPANAGGSVAGLTVIKGQRETTGITMEYGLLPGQPLASVAVIVKLNTPAVVGVPEMMPVVAPSIRPFGNAPAETTKVYGAVPPVAETVWL
jgi:hypothetical protein